LTHRIKYSLAHQSPAKQELIVIEFARRHIDAGDVASYNQRKTGRNVTHLIFTFSPKEEPKPKQAKRFKVIKGGKGAPAATGKKGGIILYPKQWSDEEVLACSNGG
jgi:hypothetical protein